MWHELWVALALMLIIEGIMPFLNPDAVRQALRQMAELDDATLRIIGFVSMVLGLICLYLVN
ncbi:MAG: DUF2065 domain-containing protein [Pseudomonadota bacterium]